jgi:hypothetical protein
LDLLFESFAISATKPFVPNSHNACAVNHEATRHPVHRKSLWEDTLGIENHPKLRGMRAQEALGIGTVPINIHGDDREPQWAQSPLQVIHERKGFKAWRAPRRPDVEVHNLALQGSDVERITCLCGCRCDPDECDNSETGSQRDPHQT